MSDRFVACLVNGLLRDNSSIQTRNYDWVRYGGARRTKLLETIRDAFAPLCRYLRVVPVHYDAAALSFILDHLDAFDASFQLLNDSHSRGMMIKVLQYRVLGHRKVKLPMSDRISDDYKTISRKYLRPKPVGSKSSICQGL